MEATCFSETLVEFQQIARCYIPVDRTLHNYRCQNTKPYIHVEYFRNINTHIMPLFIYVQGRKVHVAMNSHRLRF
jgi:hypothetical protein